MLERALNAPRSPSSCLVTAFNLMLTALGKFLEMSFNS
jgi:hypothetical protein